MKRMTKAERRREQKKQMLLQRLMGLAILAACGCWIALAGRTGFDATWVCIMAPLGMVFLVSRQQIFF